LNTQKEQKNIEEIPSKPAVTPLALTQQEQDQEKEKRFSEAIKFLLAETPITEAEYLLLAKKRASQIQKYLIETALVPSSNVFLLDSSSEIENKYADIEKSQITLPLSLKAK
jgi:hypothetical protein